MVNYNADLLPVHQHQHQCHQSHNKEQIINTLNNNYIHRSNITINKNKLFHHYKQLTSFQLKYNLLFPLAIEKFVKRIASAITVILCLQQRPSRYYNTEIKTISANLIEKNIHLLRSTLTQRSLDDYEVEVIDSNNANAGAWIGGGITIDDSLIDKIITAYARGSVTSTSVIVDENTHQVNLKNVHYQDVLACVLAHEMTHIAARHISINLTISFVLSFLCNLFKIKPEKYELALEPLMLQFSRLHEHDADCYGLLLAYNAGYNPLG